MNHGWEIRPLQDICNKASSNLMQKNIDSENGKYPVFGASGIAGYIDYYVQAKDYIGIIKDGSGVGRVSVYPKESSLLGTLQYIIPNENMDLRYVAYALKSMNLAKYVSGAAIPHIYFRDYGEEKIAVPSIKTQSKVADELDKLNELIEIKRNQIKDLDALAQSLFNETFSSIGETVPLSFYVNALVGGKSLASKEVSPNKVLKSGAVTYDYFDKNSTKYLPVDYTPDAEHSVSTGDLIISRMNTAELVGACAYVFDVDDNVYLPDRLWRIEYKSNANPIYLWKSLISESAKWQIRSKASGTSGSMKNISKPLLLSINIKKVPISIQQQFAERIEAIEAQKKRVEASIADLETLLASRMDYWFND